MAPKPRRRANAIDDYQAAAERSARDAHAILKEDAPRTPAERDAIAALDRDRWVLWHAGDYSLGVIRLLSRAGLLLDKAHAEEMAKFDRGMADAARRERLADARLISNLDAAIERAATRLDGGEDPAAVAAWMRQVREAAAHDRDRAEDLGNPRPQMAGEDR